MQLNIEKNRQYLQSFDFKTLFIEELGWSNAKNRNTATFHIGEGAYYRKPIAELSGAVVFEITNEQGTIPDSKTRDAVSKEIQKINFEHILIFIDKDRTQTIWRWLKKQDKKNLSREHYFSAGQTGDLFISKLAGLMVDISEIENDITITDVAKKIQSALDIEKVTKKFFKDYQVQFLLFVDLIEGIDNEADKKWYASVILNRLMFIYFLQKKLFLDRGNDKYLSKKLDYSTTELGKNKFYNTFLDKLFFEGFALPENLRSAATNAMIGNVKYLNGGLFLKHKIEIKYDGLIAIPDLAFENLFGLFDNYSWSLDDTLGGKDNEINPDVLGYIFEKYINQKAFGAYYTRTEITEYLCEQTVYKLILDAVNEPEIETELLKKAGLSQHPKHKNYTTIAELLINLDAPTCKKLVYGANAVLPNLSLLDPACGSGAFLVAAMKTLINVYAAILGKIHFLGDKKLTEWKNEIETKHPSINYYIKKQIITNNLYGVDIMEEATEIAKLRLFLALVASAQTAEQLEPLPNIDFNIMSGNSLIGLLRVDEERFNKHYIPVSKQPKGKVVDNQTLFKPGTIQVNLFGGEHAADKYRQLINDKEAAINSYKHAFELGITDLQDLRDSIREKEEKANEVLNELLNEEFITLGIKYEQSTWDNTKNKEGKPIKRNIEISDIETLEPFHWGYEFSEIFRKKDGFDAIITNPPWEVLQTDEKEFFQQFNSEIQKKKLRIEDWKRQFLDLMKDDDIKNNWLDYVSSYPCKSQYFKKSQQYKQVLTGKLNLYSLFVVQCFNLIKKNGYCGIVIPSGIYSDLSTSELRKLLFENTRITGLFCFENRKTIFENVDSRFKFIVLSFEKGSKTKKFPAAFMRHNVDELSTFPENGAYWISSDFISKQSPDSFSIPEIKNELDFSITTKMIEFPLLGTQSNDFKFELTQEFNITSDSHLFQTANAKGRIPLFTGKMFNQFTLTNEHSGYFISETIGRKSLLGNNKDEKQILEYQMYRWVHRRIAGNTNERTLISTITPRNVFTEVNSTTLRIIGSGLSNNDLLALTSFTNSFCLDWLIRQRVTTTLNMFYIYQLPVPRLKPTDKWYSPIVERAAKLICTTAEFTELWEEVMKTKWSMDVGATQEYERNKLRAELDGIIAHIYGLTEEEFVYILSTFPIVPQVQKVAAHNAFRDAARGLIK